MSEPYDLVILGGGIVGIWTATLAEQRGLRVAIVEIGSLELDKQQPASPPVTFTRRENLGATRARNHVLGGNSAYWGGGLARNPDDVLSQMFVDDSTAPPMKLTDGYTAVEQALGVRRAPCDQSSLPIEGIAMDEIIVLPGRRRGLWSAFSDKVASKATSIDCYPLSRIESVERGADGQLVSVAIATSSMGSQILTAPLFMLSMGVLDTNLFAQRFLDSSCTPQQREAVGRRLHDHWSIPVATIQWKNRTPASYVFPPKFQAGGIVGRRMCFTDGFFHITADFDAMPPYDRVKQFLAARQRREGFWPTAGHALASMARPWMMAMAGLHYLSKRELLVPDGREVTLTLDFESCNHPDNRVWSDGERAFLEWDVREQDLVRFRRIVEQHHPLITAALERHGLSIEWQTPFDGQEALDAFFLERAIDAYHMGGGLQSIPDEGIYTTDRDGRLRDCSNLFINSTAIFARPGLANPVLTLLARANAFVSRICGTQE